ncbi:MAG: MBL fold metallo-hydrolase [Oscillospiraceae bacterium]|nr:MBL fold metallo-hydrolase [Oscillospiraceae bacterium]
MARRKSKKSSANNNIIAVIVIIVIALAAAFAYFKDSITDIFEDADADVSGNFAVHFIDVGQGDSILIQTPEGQYMLIDTGERNQYDKLSAYLDHYNVKNFKYVIFTHPHSDHIGSSDMIVKNYNIETLIMPNVSHTTKTFERLITEIEKKELEVTQAKAGLRFNFGEAEFMILGPSPKDYDNLNNYSVVVKMIYKENAFLFTGDMEKEPENEVMEFCDENNISLFADVLKVAHHGSSTSSQDTFLNRIDSKYAVIFCGADNSYNHPNLKVVERLEAGGARVLRTDLEGDIVIVSDGVNLSVKKGRGDFAKHNPANEANAETEQNEE